MFFELTLNRLDDVVTSIQQRWGAQALRRLEQSATRLPGIPTGYDALDRLLGVDGVPRGALTRVSGRPTSGKTSLALAALARAQAEGEVTVRIDCQRSADPESIERHGIDLARLLIVWPDPPALGLSIARDIMASGGAGLIVVDESDGLGLARGAGQALRHLSAAARRSPYALLWLADDPESAFAARADVQLRAERQRWLMDAYGVSGYETRLTLLQSRFGPPGGSVSVPISLRPVP